MSETTQTSGQKGFLGMVERVGNRLPDPVFIFLFLIAILIGVSILCSVLGVSAAHPTQIAEDGSGPLMITSKSLLAPENIQKLWGDMPKTFTHFHPLGYVLVVMLGAGVAERSGLFASGIKSAMRGAPKALLTPIVALVAMLSNHAADAGYVVMIPLAAIIFASAGRNPMAGIAAAFAGVSGGFSANFTPGQLDALLFGITEAAVDGAGIGTDWTMNIAGNWYFIAALLCIYLPVIWFVTDKIIEPRLGKWEATGDYASQYADEDKPLTDGEKTGLKRAGLAILAICGLWALMTLGPGTPLLNDGSMIDRLSFIEKWGAMFKALLLIGLIYGTFKLFSMLPAIKWYFKIPLVLSIVLASLFIGFLLVIFGPGLPTEGIEGQAWYVTATPFFKSLVAGFMMLFLAAGWAYGTAAGTIKSGDDLVGMMTDAMKDMGYYLVLAFAAAHFVAMFNWSNLGLISAVHGAGAIEASGLPLPVVLGLIVLFTGLLNLFVGSASAKWALLAPVLVPMLMLLGISPEGATAAYRVGDGATNIITPLMVYFPLILIFAQRWQKDFGIGSLTAMMIPYSIWMLVSGAALMVIWIMFGLDLGPGASMMFDLPEIATP